MEEAGGVFFCFLGGYMEASLHCLRIKVDWRESRQPKFGRLLIFDSDLSMREEGSYNPSEYLSIQTSPWLERHQRSNICLRCAIIRRDHLLYL